jgi:integrase
MVPRLKSRAKRPNSKPAKPRSDFPLFPHARGYWAKKVRGKLVYFGKVADDPKGETAVGQWLDQKDELLAGRTPRVHQGGLTVRDLANAFLTAKRRLVDTREISSRTFADYFSTCARLCEALGKQRLVDDLAADDFERLRSNLGKVWGPVAIGNEINRARVVFKYGYDAGLLDKPMRYGPHFKRPSRRVLRRARAAKGSRMLEAADIRRVLDVALQPLRAMILLGINCGLGNSDVGQLERRHLDLRSGWLDYPRPKTGVDRRTKLWPETIAALREAIEMRPDAKDDGNAELVFVTKYGLSWSKETRDNPVAKEFVKLLKSLKLHRTGLGFYALRHAFETIGGEVKDQVAVDHIMGHARDDMASVYRERISDERLKTVSDRVRKWLFPKAKAAPKKKATAKCCGVSMSRMLAD